MVTSWYILIFKNQALQIRIILNIITSTSDLQPSTATANQLPNQLVSTQIRPQGKIALNSLLYSTDSMPSTKIV